LRCPFAVGDKARDGRIAEELMRHAPPVAVLAACLLPAGAQAQIQVVSTTPALNATAATGAAISIEFDRPLDTTAINADTFRVYGRWSGTVRGTYVFSNGNRIATLVPDDPFSAGEIVFVNLSHDIRGADASALRAAGYAYQFVTAVAGSAATFEEIDSFSNRTGSQTRIYGASAADLNGDRFLDLATINEVSGDVRVFLNRADGTGLYGPMLPPEDIGLEASPNEPADFDNDGRMDLCVAAAMDDNVWILRGAGDGTFSSVQEVELPPGAEPHGITPIDVDGDGDLDIVNANVGSNDLSLMLNDGAGVFGAPSFFEGGVNGEYGLAAADMNRDGVTDLVVAGRNDGEIVTLLGNGDATFSAAGPPQDTGGLTWVVVLGDVNGDGDLDAATANDGTGTVGVLRGQGDGTWAPPAIVPIGSHVPATDLGDLDGDGDLDMVVSSFGGGFWRWYRNDGTGAFTLVEEFPALSNPSCAVLLDFDNDGDLDMTLFDEIADVVKLMENGGASACSPTPQACRPPVLPARSRLRLVQTGSLGGERLAWRWAKGTATPKADFGDPLVTDGYELCLYEDTALAQSFAAPAGESGGPCGVRPCWRETAKGFVYRDPQLTPDGVATLRLTEGLADGQARIRLRGKGGRLGLPDLATLTGVLHVQLQKTAGDACWGATFTPPFQRHDEAVLVALSDVPTTTTTTTTTTSTTTTSLPALWSAIQAQVIGPTCGGCHGIQAGLTGLGGCNTGHASLFGVASTELPSMARVEPGDPANSWLMHKLDGTQGWFNPMCQGGFCGSQMPLGGPPLVPEVRDAIRAWISQGAVNDCP
jgi:hypothetical protein